MTDLYNRTFNCYVRPKYDGTHQEFPDLDLKGLGIDKLYDSQKDAIWMDKLLGGGIIDHEVGGGKTLITVSYTHLDVYKRQIPNSPSARIPIAA